MKNTLKLLALVIVPLAVFTSITVAGASATTRLNVPSAPTFVTSDVYQGSVNVWWSAPTKTGPAPITSYCVTVVSPSGKEVAPRCSDAATMKMTYHTLTTGVPYSFKVSATNRFGTSDWSTPSARVELVAGD